MYFSLCFRVRAIKAVAVYIRCHLGLLDQTKKAGQHLTKKQMHFRGETSLALAFGLETSRASGPRYAILVLPSWY